MSVLTLPTTVITASGSPWANPAGWDAFTIGGVSYGWAISGQPTQSTVALATGLVASTGVIGGFVRIQGARRSYRFDEKQPKGQDGWVTTYRGKKPKPFKIIFYIWTDAQYQYFIQTVFPFLPYGAGLNIDNPNVSATVNTGNGVIQSNSLNPNGIQSLAIYHPITSLLQINSVEVHEFGAPEPEHTGWNEAPQMYTATVEVSEYLPPPPPNVTSTASGSKNVNQPTTPGQVPSPAAQAAAQHLFNAQNRSNQLDNLPVPIAAP